MKKAAIIACIMLAFPIDGLNAVETSYKINIIYTDKYNITLFGLEKLHPFDSEKYGKAYRYLINEAKLNKSDFYNPEIVSEQGLLSVHTQEYLDSLKNSANVARIAELQILASLPNFLLQERLLKPMKYAVGGTILGSQLALKHGWAINLSGGYHHAKADSGSGFCFFADIPIAVYKLFKQRPDMSILIIDLDAHQGNGVESIFADDPRVNIFDVFNGEIYPNDFDAKKYIDFQFPLPSQTADKEYLALIQREIPEAIKKTAPDLIIYNAGTDIFKSDPLGRMDITADGIIRRDEIVFRSALEKRTPILMVLSGGYTKKSSVIIGKSIENLLTNVISAKNQTVSK
ncbi:MAG: histone deacetylase [Candidatus Omnitrophota bacterium]